MVVAGLVSLLVIAFTIATAVQAKRIALERDRANQQAAVATQVSDFLIELFETSDPEESKGENVTAREILDRGAERIENELTDQPEVQARLMSSIGWVYQTVGLFDDAERLLRRAIDLQRRYLGPEDPETLATMASLNETLYRLGRYSELEALDVELLQLRRRVFGEDHPDTLESYEAVAITSMDKGRLAEAQPLMQHVLELMALGRYDEANEQLTLALDRERRLAGDTHPDTLAYERSLARLRLAEGRSEEALRILERNVAATRAASEDPLDLAEALMLDGEALMLDGEALQAVGRRDESEAVLAEALTLLEATLPEDHPDLVRTRELLEFARSGAAY